MRVILFGATGMVGQGVLRECLLDEGVESVLCIGRATTGQTHPRLREVVHKNLADLTPLAPQLVGHDACFFCLGVSSAGMNEADYTHVTFDLTLGAARVLAKECPGMTFIYVSGAGTDSSERGRSMWARVKGRTENELLKLPFKAAYMFRPAAIQPLHGITSKTRLYRALYTMAVPIFPLVKAVAPKLVTTTELVGRAMLQVARHGAEQRILENDAINAIGRAASAGGATAVSG
jgi:uncharacterized protein YbjT (DUF2867 family)